MRGVKISINGEVRKFLEYLFQNSTFQGKREHSFLKGKFGKENFENLEDICFREGYTKREVNDDKKDRKLFSRVTIKGLRFLAESEREDKKIKYSQYMLWATMGLVGVTLFYAFLVYQSNQIASSQFEVENRPYLFPSQVVPSESSEGFLKYGFDITNFGNTPARIIGVKFYVVPSGEEILVNSFDSRTIIRKNEAKPFSITETEINTMVQSGLVLTINYTGVGELSDTFYSYEETWEIDKETNSVHVKEGEV